MDIRDYVQLFRSFVEGNLTASEFQGGFLKAHRSERGWLGAAEESVGAVFAAVDAFPSSAEPEEAAMILRDAVNRQLPRLEALSGSQALKAGTSVDIARFLNDPDPEVRGWAAIVATDFKLEGVRGSLTQAMSDPVRRVRELAAQSLAVLGDAGALEAIAKLLREETDREYRPEIWAVRRIGEIGPEPLRARAIEILIEHAARTGTGGAAAARAADWLRSRPATDEGT